MTQKVPYIVIKQKKGRGMAKASKDIRPYHNDEIIRVVAYSRLTHGRFHHSEWVCNGDDTFLNKNDGRVISVKEIMGVDKISIASIHLL